MTVTYLSEFESFTKDSSEGSDKYTEIAKKNPIAVVAILVLVLIALMVSFAWFYIVYQPKYILLMIVLERVRKNII